MKLQKLLLFYLKEYAIANNLSTYIRFFLNIYYYLLTTY